MYADDTIIYFNMDDFDPYSGERDRKFILLLFLFNKFYSEIGTQILTTIDHIAFGVCKNHS